MNRYPSHIVFFDGICNFCNASVQFIAKRNKKQNIYFTHLDSPFSRELLQQAPAHIKGSDSIIFFQDGQWYHKPEAALKIARHLTYPWRLAGIFKILPLRFRDMIYDLIAKNRYSWFGQKTSCNIPDPGQKNRLIENFFEGQML